MISDLNCKPFSPAQMDRKSGSKCIPCYMGHCPHYANFIAIIPLNQTLQKSF